MSFLNAIILSGGNKMLIEFLENLKLLESEFYNIDFKSGKELKKCTIESAGQKLLVTDGAKVKYLIEPSSIEKVSAFSNYIR